MKTKDGVEFDLGMTLYAPDLQISTVEEFGTAGEVDELRDGALHSWQRRVPLTIADKYAHRDNAEIALDVTVYTTRDGQPFVLGRNYYVIHEDDDGVWSGVSNVETSSHTHHRYRGSVCRIGETHGPSVRSLYAFKECAESDYRATIFRSDVSKQDAINTIRRIRGGEGGCNSGTPQQRRDFPESMKGSIARDQWDNTEFSFGFEYGYIAGLMFAFGLTTDDL